MSAAHKPGAILWAGVESPAQRTIDDAYFGPQWLSEKFNEQAELFSVLFSDFSRKTAAPILNSFEKDEVYLAWRDLAFEIDRFFDHYQNVLSCIHFRPGDPARPHFLPCGPASVSVRRKLGNFFAILMRRLEEAELPIRRLDAAVKAIEIGEARAGAELKIYRKAPVGVPALKAP